MALRTFVVSSLLLVNTSLAIQNPMLHGHRHAFGPRKSPDDLARGVWDFLRNYNYQQLPASQTYLVCQIRIPISSVFRREQSQSTIMTGY